MVTNLPSSASPRTVLMPSPVGGVAAAQRVRLNPPAVHHLGVAHRLWLDLLEHLLGYPDDALGRLKAGGL
jgi:hypothetical protein